MNKGFIQQMNNGIAKMIELRMTRGFNMYMSGKVHKDIDTHYIVNSDSWNNEYDVNIVSGKYFNCTCPDFEKWSKYFNCKHIIAVIHRINNSDNIQYEGMGPE